MAGFYSKPQSKFSTELSQKLESTDGVIYLAADVTETQGYLVIAPGTSQEEIVKYTSQATGLVSGAVRGLSTVGTAETAGTGKVHSAGTPVEMRNVHYYWARSIDALNGVSATSANIFAIGENVATASAITTTKGVFHYFGTSASSAMAGIGLSSNGFAVWTDDQGTNWHRLSATGGAITGGDGINNTGGTLDVECSDLISATGGISSDGSNNFIVNKATDYDWSGTHIISSGGVLDVSGGTFKINNTTVSASAEEINQVVTGASAYTQVTPFNLSALVDEGQIGTSNGHYHFFIAGISSRVSGSTGTQDISFTPAFVPRLLEINYHSLTQGGGSATGSFGSGYATDTTAEGCTYSYGGSLIGTQNASNIVEMRDNGGVTVVGNVSVMSAGRVTLNWTTNSSAGGDRFYTYKIFG